MKEFVHKHEDRIHGVLSCFDRMLFRGYSLVIDPGSRTFDWLAHLSQLTVAFMGIGAFYARK